MKKPNDYIFLCLIFLSIISCDDILEEDISNDTIQMITPIQGAIIEGNTVQFSWQNLNGADNYRIQVLNSNQSYALDSLVSTNNFVYTLNPGSYQWRVKGENFAYETQYTFPVGFTVEASDNLSNQTVILLTPSNNIYTNNTNIILTWNSLNAADYYNLDLIKLFNGQETVFQQTNILPTSFNVPSSTFTEDAEYKWKVKALNSTSESPFSERSIYVDRATPNQPALVSPNDQATVTNVVTFNWVNGTDTGNVQSTITNTIEISSDINFSALINTSNTVNNSYQYTFSSSGSYYWRVKSSDAASNVSDFSNVRSITIQ